MGQAGKPVAFDERLVGALSADVDVLPLDEALNRLAGFDGDGAAPPSCGVFGGLFPSSGAHVLDVSVPVVERDWLTPAAALDPRGRVAALSEAWQVRRSSRGWRLSARC